MLINIKVIAVLGLLTLSPCLWAEGSLTFTPLSLNLLPPVQFPVQEGTVAGARVSLFWGHQKNVFGLDISGLGNITDGNFLGSSFSGVFNETGDLAGIVGIQLAGLVNITRGTTYVFGLQVAGLSNMNRKTANVIGVEFAGLLNYGPSTTIVGLQAGLVNRAKTVYGLQIGLVNFAESLHGIQIGAANFTLSLIPFMPILNVSI